LLCTIWKDIVLVRMVLKIRIGLSIGIRLQGKYGITRLIFLFVCICRVPIQPMQVSGIVSRCSVTSCNKNWTVVCSIV